MFELTKEKIYLFLTNLKNKMKKNNGFVEVKKTKEFLLASGSGEIIDATIIDDIKNDNTINDSYLSLKERVIDKTKGYLYNLEFDYGSVIGNNAEDLKFIRTTVVFPDDWVIIGKDNVTIELLDYDEESKAKCYKIQSDNFDNLIDYISKNVEIFTELAKQEQDLRNDLEEKLKLLQKQKTELINKI